MFSKLDSWNKLQSLITIGDETNRLSRAFLQVLYDQGGSPEDLDRLITDAKGEKAILTKFARILIGPFWELADKRLHLDPIDFQCPASEFRARYQNLVKTDGVLSHPGKDDDALWGETESAPARPCCYKLLHLPKPLLFDKVLAQKEEFAGWRELVVYLALVDRLYPLALKDQQRFSVIAAGSSCIHNLSGSLCRVRVCGENINGKIVVHWDPIWCPNDDKGSPDDFYLVRVY